MPCSSSLPIVLSRRRHLGRCAGGGGLVGGAAGSGLAGGGLGGDELRGGLLGRPCGRPRVAGAHSAVGAHGGGGACGGATVSLSYGLPCSSALHAPVHGQYLRLI